MMEYYYSGTESLWCGNWNHLACRRWKCEVDHPSQSTEVNLGKKQKWCSLWCPWYQVQQDTSGPDNFRILGCLWTIHHRCTCKWDWIKLHILRDCLHMYNCTVTTIMTFSQVSKFGFALMCPPLPAMHKRGSALPGAMPLSFSCWNTELSRKLAYLEPSDPKMTGFTKLNPLHQK